MIQVEYIEPTRSVKNPRIGIKLGDTTHNVDFDTALQLSRDINVILSMYHNYGRVVDEEKLPNPTKLRYRQDERKTELDLEESTQVFLLQNSHAHLTLGTLYDMSREIIELMMWRWRNAEIERILKYELLPSDDE